MTSTEPMTTKAIEPAEYFASIKAEFRDADADELDAMLRTVEKQMIDAQRAGQKTFIERLVFSRSSIIREMQAALAGIDHYVYKDAIKNLIDKVKPEGSIKIIELDRYTRLIPPANVDEIERVRALGLFDEFCVVYTDLTGESMETAEDQEFKSRNRDPIVFGYFREPATSFKHDRFYVVTDWEDENCDLTFDKLIHKLAKADYGNTGLIDPAEIQRIVDDANSSEDEPKPAASFFQRMKEWMTR